MNKMKGFTLVELMIVVAIIGIISLFAVPSYQNAQRKAKIAEGIASLHEAQSAVEKYRLEKRVPYNKIEFNKILGFDPIVKHGSQTVYIISYKADEKVSNGGKFAGTYLLTATAQGKWLGAKDPCKVVTLRNNGDISPAECQK